MGARLGLNVSAGSVHGPIYIDLMEKSPQSDQNVH